MANKQEIRHGHLNKFGSARASLEDEIDRVNDERSEQASKEDLEKYKSTFLRIDQDGSGDLDSFELLNFLNSVGMKDGGSAWTEPKIKNKVISKFGTNGKMRYDGFLNMVLGNEMGRVLRLKLKFENLAKEASQPKSSADFR
eukprot:CAMPEP_0119118538 /NCGR_PEP_ID=MMETSP1310-20130426/386_1 /TAXON_ID=464262 /ORGANISM="Genus nov. species nov., Strain RCC2339" /LENGTH=141 /DNA_ID=CAMNT_0007107915 /DNA_START=81 /DNA_END=506 /DNA_ORIENTATION=-